MVAVVPDNGGQKLSKRLIGFPGETIKIQNQKVYINGEELIEDYAFYSEKINRKYPEIELTLGEDGYFVLGDNRMISADSLIYYVYLQNGKPIEDTVGIIHRRYLTSAFYSFSLDDFVEPLVNIYLEYKERKL